MTHAIPHILASDDGALIKLAFWGIIILIFGIVKFVKFIGKLASPTNPAESASPPPAMRNARQAPPMSNRAAAPNRAPAAAGAIALPPLSARVPTQARRKVARKVVPAQPPVIPASPLGGITGTLQQPRVAPAAPPPVAVSRSRVAGWLDSRTIRAQFILSEAMKPPASLK